MERNENPIQENFNEFFHHVQFFTEVHWLALREWPLCSKISAFLSSAELMCYLRSSVIYVMPIISWPILLHNISIIVHEKMNDTYVVKQKQKKHILSASSCCVKNMKYRLRLREMHTLSSSRTFQSWTWRSKFKSDLAEMCSHSKKLRRSWTALVEVMSVPDDAEYSQRLTWSPGGSSLTTVGGYRPVLGLTQFFGWPFPYMAGVTLLPREKQVVLRNNLLLEFC